MYWFAIIADILIMASLIAGQVAAPGTAMGRRECACKADLEWYNSLKPWKKFIYSAWWAGRKIACAAKWLLRL